MRYVLHYYKEGKLDTQRALDKIQTRTGIRPKTAKHLYQRWTAIAASVLVAASLGTYLYLKPSTTTLTAEATQQVYRLPDGKPSSPSITMPVILSLLLTMTTPSATSARTCKWKSRKLAHA